MSEKAFKDIIKLQTIASEYSTYLMENNTDDHLADSAKLEAEYKKDTTLYDCVDFRIFTIAPETATTASDATQAEKDAATKQANEAAKKKADEMFGKIKDEASFIKLAEQYATKEQKETTDFTKDEATLMKYVEKATYESSFGADATKWLFSKDTKVNDKKMFDVNGTYYIFYMIKTAYRDDATIPVDVRHILYQFDDTAKDKDADKAKQKAAAEATVNAINKADDKLASFLEWCEKDSDDTGSKSNGGLIEYLGRGKYVKAFEEWSLDAKRQEGDIEVIETEYGYHVMYFVSKDGKYNGGNIAPGIKMRLKALHEYTSRLPMVDKEGDTPTIGYDTETAIRSGVINGICHEIEGYINEFKQKYCDVLVFLTGGDEKPLKNRIKNCIFADKYLVAKGLNRILTDYGNK